MDAIVSEFASARAFVTQYSPDFLLYNSAMTLFLCLFNLIGLWSRFRIMHRLKKLTRRADKAEALIRELEHRELRNVLVAVKRHHVDKLDDHSVQNDQGDVHP